MGPDELKENDEKDPNELSSNEGSEGNEAIVTEVSEEPGSKETKVDYTSKENNKSVRESIKNSLKQHSEKDEDKENNDDKNEATLEAITGEKKEPKTKEKAETSTTKIRAEKPPISWTDGAKKQWDKLPQDVIDATIKREKEIDEGFKALETRKVDLERLKEIDTVLAPRLDAIKRNGYSVPSVINNMFQWMEALADPSKKVIAIQQLAKNYGVDLARLAPNNNETNENDDQNTQTQQVNIQADPAFQALQQQLNTVLQTAEQERRNNADKFVKDWAKDKPHYEKIKMLMGQLLASGAIPLKPNGDLDLDKAYQSACYADPDIRVSLQKEELDKKEVEKKKLAEETARKNKERAEKARTASASLRPSAPNPSNSKQTQPTKVNGKPISVRDSIRQTIQQLNDA